MGFFVKLLWKLGIVFLKINKEYFFSHVQKRDNFAKILGKRRIYFLPLFSIFILVWRLSCESNSNRIPPDVSYQDVCLSSCIRQVFQAQVSIRQAINMHFKCQPDTNWSEKTMIFSNFDWPQMLIHTTTKTLKQNLEENFLHNGPKLTSSIHF